MRFFLVTVVMYNIVVFTKSVNSNFWSLIGSRNSEYPWLFTVLRPEPRWRVVSRHFRKTKFELQMKQSYEQIPRKRRTLSSRRLLVGRKISFMLNLQQNRKNAFDKIPEIFANCRQSSY